MTVPDLLHVVYGHEQLKYLIGLVVANLVLGVAASVKAGDFHLTLVADWLTKRVLPLLAGYGSAALLAWSNPELALLRDAAFGTLVLALFGYVTSNLADLGVPIPAPLARPKPDVLGGSTPREQREAAGDAARAFAGPRRGG